MANTGTRERRERVISMRPLTDTSRQDVSPSLNRAPNQYTTISQTEKLAPFKT